MATTSGIKINNTVLTANNLFKFITVIDVDTDGNIYIPIRVTVDNEQEIFERWKSLRKLVNKGKAFISYYKRSLKNYAIQLIRREHRERVIPGSCLCKSDISNIKYHVSVEDEFLLREEIPKYWKSLSTLERDVLYFYTKGYSFEEISLKLEKSVAGTKSALNRCHKKFKIFYNKIQEDKMK